MACASTVAVVVPSPATSDVLLATSRTIWAPMFSSAFLRSISLATVTPSLVIVGDPNFLSMMTLRPLGPRVTLTASANRLTPRRIACRDWSPYVICFAMMSVSYDALLPWFLFFFLRIVGTRLVAFVVRYWSGRNRYVIRTLLIWLRELGDDVEPSGPNFEEPGVGNEHGCEDVSHVDLHRHSSR